MMPAEIKTICLENKGTEYDYKEAWQSERALVGSKMYLMMGTNKAGNPIVTLKVEPSEGARYRELFPNVVLEGYYMNKVHWISIRLDCEFDDVLLKKLIIDAYQLVLQKLPKKIQAEILA